MDDDVRPGGPPNVVLVVVTAIVLLLVTAIGSVVLMANVMSCDAGGEGCENRALGATLAWGIVSFVGPLAAMVWGLIARRTTSRGRASRWIALALVILLPVLGMALNLAILFVGRTS